MLRSASRFSAILAAFLLLAVGACSSPGGGAAGFCRVGWIASCVCSNGGIGQHVCEANGQFGVCDCGPGDIELTPDGSATEATDTTDEASSAEATGDEGVGEVGIETAPETGGATSVESAGETAVELADEVTTSVTETVADTDVAETVADTGVTETVADTDVAETVADSTQDTAEAEVVVDAGGPTTSAQIAVVRATLPGGSLALPVTNAIVTYVTAASGDDPAGFFVQGETEGPALFVAVEPSSLVPPPVRGAVVDFEVRTVAVVSDQVRVTAVGGYARTGTGADVDHLMQDLTTATDVDSPANYDGELVAITGLLKGPTQVAGTAHTTFEIVTDVVQSSNLKVRIPDAILATVHMAPGCRVFVGPTPLWRYRTQSEVQVYGPDDLLVLECPSTSPHALFTEYVHGSANNHALEIRNLGPETLDLARCEIELYANGSLSSENRYGFPAVTLAAGAAFVVCDAQAGPALLPYCTGLDSTPTKFNGDDALELRCDGVVVDSIGQVGFDPGTSWVNGAVSTRSKTLRRKCLIEAGDALSSDLFDPALEWDAFPIDSFDGLTSDCNPAVP